MTSRCIVLGLLMSLGASACNPEADTPKGAARVFLRAIAVNDHAQTYAMLSPQDQARLKKIAELASAHTGGRRTFKPEELMAPTLDSPQSRLSRIDVTAIKGDRAEVTLSNIDGSSKEVLRMVKVKGRWRIVLNKPLSPTRYPSSLPASRPTATSRPTSQPQAAGKGAQPASQKTPTPAP